jgi:hypothetical protein
LVDAQGSPAAFVLPHYVTLRTAASLLEGWRVLRLALGAHQPDFIVVAIFYISKFVPCRWPNLIGFKSDSHHEY